LNCEVYFDRKESPAPSSLKISPKHRYHATNLLCIKYQKTTFKTAIPNAGKDKGERSALS